MGPPGFDGEPGMNGTIGPPGVDVSSIFIVAECIINYVGFPMS